MLRVRFLDEPRAEVDDLAAFERFLQKAFARRRRTLENNLEDSYPNLKEYLRFLNLEGSRRAETLSVVELARLWAALRGGGHERAERRIEPRVKPTGAVRLIPLGGLGEFGLNAMVLEWEDHLLLLDAGMLFPSAEMPGVDFIVPDFEYLAERRDRCAASC